jgi:hypothetical protein
MSKVTVREAAILTGKSRETINAATKDGTLSFSLNGRNTKVIDIAELERVYPIVNSIEKLNQSDAVRTSQEVSEEGQTEVREQLAVLKERLESYSREKEMILQERDRERRQLQSEIETLRSTLEKAQEQHGKAMLLLTDQSENKSKPQSNGAGEWEKAFKALEERISNQDSQAKKEIEEIKKNSQQQVMRYKTALEAEKNKPFWKKIFAT